jgi:hypothetical protein
LTACNSKSINKNITNKTIDSSISKIKAQKLETINIQIDTLQINNQQYIQFSRSNKFNCLLSIKGDTLIKSEDYYFEAEFLDINEDGYKDIQISLFTNNPNDRENYLFDKKHNSFKLIENCERYIQKIKGTNFYYSYNRTGCSDMNWESYLSKIENYKLVNYGYIYGQGCDYEIKSNPKIIEIYKVLNSDTDEKVLIKKLPYQKYIKEFSEKWDFIKIYWTTNYNAFES